MAGLSEASRAELSRARVIYGSKRQLALLDDTVQRLAASPFMLGDAFTMADVSIGYALKLAGYCQVPLPGSLHLYYERLRARPAFQRAEARQKEG